MEENDNHRFTSETEEAYRENLFRSIGIGKGFSLKPDGPTALLS